MTRVESLRKRLIMSARTEATSGVLRRPYRLQDIDPALRDTRIATTSAGRRERFALSMADFFLGRRIVESLPLVAAAAGLTGDPELRRHALDGLDELAGWSPLNRPGYTLGRPGPDPPEPFHDGNWLGTGLSIRAIVTAVALLGADVPATLRQRIDTLLGSEIAGVDDDFRLRRAWWVDAPVSNQYVLPVVGALLACLHLGRDRHAAAYEENVNRLLRSADAQGHDGTHREGTHYGAFTTGEMLHAANAMTRVGDHRLINHPHLKHHHQWLIALLQPGGHLVNFFDGTDRHFHVGNESTPDGRAIIDCLMLSALSDDAPSARWVVDRVLGGPPPTLLGLIYAEKFHDPADGPTPRTWARFDTSPLVSWRSDWSEGATGVWVRGGGVGDFHDHHDHGHLNLILHGRPVLIDCGTPEYSNAQMDSFFKAGKGHNVLDFEDGVGQIGPKEQDINIVVRRLDQLRGDVELDAAPSYSAGRISLWRRHLRWDEAEVIIRDTVRLTSPRPQLIRFHLGDDTPAVVSANLGSRRWIVTWSDIVFTFESDVRLVIKTVMYPHAISYTRLGRHVCLVVVPAEPCVEWRLVTRVAADR